MDWRTRYADKLTTPEDAVSAVKDGDRVVVGMHYQTPLALCRALAARARDLRDVEIENSIEASIGVALPPASLLRARTIGHIAKLIAEHLGAKTAGGPPVPAIPAARPATTDEVNLEALSDDDIDRLLGDDAAEGEKTAS